jgi:EpsI family protein
MQPLGTWRRFLPVLILLALPSLVVARRARKEVLPPHQELSAFPMQIAGMQAQDLPLTQDELRVLGPGEFLLRNYLGPSDQTPLNLYVAFFPSQRTGDTIHSPKNCLPGAGWMPLESRHMLLRGPDGAAISVERYLIGRGADRDVVLYWYQAHGRITPSEYWAKIFLVIDAIRMNRTDGALVRVVARVEPGTNPAIAEKRAVDFAEEILPELNSYVPN